MSPTDSCLHQLKSRCGLTDFRLGSCGLQLILGALFFTTGFVQAQEALRNAVRTEAGYVQRRAYYATPRGDEPGWNAGPVRFSLSASYAMEFNDNITYSEASPASDLIQIPSVSLGIAVPLSQQSDLTFQVGVGYRSYWDNDGLSRWEIDPGSVLAYDLQVQDVYISVFNRFDYTSQVQYEAGLANIAQFPRFLNTAGLQVAWVPGDWLVSGGYSYQIAYTDSDTLSYINRGSHLLYAQGGRLFGEGAGNAGVEASATLSDYTDNTAFSETTVVSLGPYVTWQVTDAIDVALRGGYVFYSTMLNPSGSTDQNSYYLGFAGGQQLTDWISHRLQFTRRVNPGVVDGSAFTIEDVIEYFIAWNFVDPASVGARVFYTHGQQEAASGLGASEIYDQVRFRIGLTWNVISNLDLDVGYAIVVRESDLPGRSYTQNSVTFGAIYRFE